MSDNKRGNARRRMSSEDTLDLDESDKILKQQLFTVHYPSSSPITCQVSLSSSELILEEVDESGYESDDGTNGRETHLLKDIYGFHIVRKEVDEPSLTTVYACLIFYTNDKVKANTRSRVARILEINESQHSYEANLNVAKEWSVEIGKVFQVQFPNCYKSQNAQKGLEEEIEGIFAGLKVAGSEKEECNSKSDDKDSNNGIEVVKTEINLEFDTATFSLVKSILFNRHFLVIVNPVSGQGKGTNLLQEYILPVFADSGIQIDLLVTKHAGHARSFITETDLSNIDGIVSVGGDGVLNEIVNGLRSKDPLGKFDKIPIGVVATGSGNGLARSMADYCSSSKEYQANSTLHSTLAVARGCVAPVNLTEVTLDKKVLYSFLSVGWGLMSDIDIESEVLRSIGEIRFFIWSFLKLAKLRRYKAELSYVPYDASGCVSSRVKVDDEFVCVYSACQSYIGSFLLFAPEAKQYDHTIHLAYLPSNTGRLAAATFLHKLDTGSGEHLKVNPVQYVKVKEFTLRCEGGIEGCLTMDGEQIHGEEITIKLCDSPLYVLSMG